MTAPREHDALELLKKIRYDLTALQAKVTDLGRILADANLKPPNEYTCPKCGIHLAAAHLLDEHHYHAHNGPEPAHWLEAEARTDTRF